MRDNEAKLTNQTYICARNSGDMRYLMFIQARMVHVYKESPNIDFVQTMDSFVDYFERRYNVPAWLNWLLKKYEL